MISLHSFHLVSSAHFIVGIVEDALDGTLADDQVAVVWNPVNGIADNVTDIIGPNGNSGVSNIYFADCELLNTPCIIGDEIFIRVTDSGTGYVSSNVSVTVTGAGFDVAPNITLNSPPVISSVLVDDIFPSPANEIDLLTGITQAVTCEAIVEELDNDTLQNVSGVFFDSVASSFGALDDNNSHYTNSSCYLNSSYGTENQTSITCGFDVEYYANSQNWDCEIYAEDSYNASSSQSNTTFINPLLSIQVVSLVDFGSINGLQFSNETTINISNYGNVMINLSLSGYSFVEGDGNAMNCSDSYLQNISIEHMKYNLTDSNPGTITQLQSNSLYTNLTSAPFVNEINLDYRTDDFSNNAINSTYWRVYAPNGISGTCEGNIIFGAVQT